MRRFRWFLAGFAAAGVMGGSVVVANPSGLPIVAHLHRIENKIDHVIELIVGEPHVHVDEEREESP